MIVKVANGHNLKVKEIEDVELFGKKNTNTLYVPQFTFDLISISKITKDYNYKVIFDNDFVTFQDIKTNKVIGRGSKRNNLYFFLDQNSHALMACQKNNYIF